MKGGVEQSTSREIGPVKLGTEFIMKRQRNESLFCMNIFMMLEA
jgi:hypothetical protein